MASALDTLLPTINFSDEVGSLSIIHPEVAAIRLPNNEKGIRSNDPNTKRIRCSILLLRCLFRTKSTVHRCSFPTLYKTHKSLHTKGFKNRRNHRYKPSRSQ